jgi:3-oxoadipate enol-lactonase
MTVELHRVTLGRADAPTLVLGSSLGTAHAMFDRNVPALSERYRIVLYDHRGHGASPSAPGPWEIEDLGRDVLALLDSLSLERVAVGGVSMGGMMAMWLGINAPERVAALVPCCTTANFGDPDVFTERLRMLREAGSTAPLAPAVVERWLTPAYAAEHPDDVDWLRGMVAATPADSYAECCGALARMDLSGDLHRITAPTLVIGAADDPSTPPEHQRAIAERIPGARLEILPDAAHLANVQYADRVNALMLDFLGEVL